MNSKTALVTGSTGLLGSWLICKLLSDSDYAQVFAVVRGDTAELARNRLLKILDIIPHGLNKDMFKRLKVFQGDVTEQNLGISSSNANLLKGKLTDIFHSAAIAEFNYSIARIRPSNVMGTTNIFRFARKMAVDKPINVHHISTIAVGGDLQGWFGENQFQEGQGFHNAYEQSKYEAEAIARKETNKNLRVKIYRPAIITGDSRYGITTNFKMIYQPLHFLSHNLFSKLPAHEDTFHSMVPVDYVADAIAILSKMDNHEMSVHHIVNPHEVRFGNFVKTASKVFNFKSPELVPIEVFNKKLLSKAQWRLIDPFLPYLNYKLRFKAEKTNRILKSVGFEWPVMDEALLSKLFKYCVKTKFIPPI